MGALVPHSSVSTEFFLPFHFSQLGGRTAVSHGGGSFLQMTNEIECFFYVYHLWDILLQVFAYFLKRWVSDLLIYEFLYILDMKA